MYDKLKEYKEKNGDCLVPISEGKLGKWVSVQRNRYKGPSGRSKQLTAEQVRLLNDIGFVWTANYCGSLAPWCKQKLGEARNEHQLREQKKLEEARFEQLCEQKYQELQMVRQKRLDFPRKAVRSVNEMIDEWKTVKSEQKW